MKHPSEMRADLRRREKRLDRAELQVMGYRNRSSSRPEFGVEWMRRYLHHYMGDPLSIFHEHLADDLHEIQSIRGQKRNYIAPRGSGKTAWMSKGYVLHGAIEGIEPLTLLLAETGEQAKKYLDSVKEEIELNPMIAKDYPLVAGKGRLWQSDRIRLKNGCEIVARGAGGRILGMTRRNRRPTLVVIDDGNQRGDAYSPTTRQRKIDWVVKDVLPAGEPSTNFVVAGTPIHREAIVCDLKRAGWQTRSYNAMDRAPDNQELWQQWERIVMNLADLDREQHGAEFYEEHREAMDAGSELLWKERLTLYELMLYRARYGESAYRTEYTSDPGSPEGAEWPAEHFDYPGFWFEEFPEDELALKVISLDPSKGGESQGGDYQAHAKIGLGAVGTKHGGTLFIECDLRREHPEAMVARTVGFYRDWNKIGRSVDRVIVEDNGTMGLISGAIQATLGADLMPWECLTQIDNKDLRIRVAGPYLSQHRIRVRNTPGGRMLVDQWRDFPWGSHDDACDAVATGIRWMQMALARR